MSLTLKDARNALYSRVVALLAGNGVDASDIKNFRTARFGSNPTHVVVSTLFAEANELTASDVDPAFHFFVQILARYNDEPSELAAEDALDDLSYLLITGLTPHAAGDAWETLTITQTPPRVSRRYGSHNYRVCEIRMKLETT